MAILTDLSKEELIARLTAAEAKAERKLSLKVSEKGGVQLNGLRRFPVTFYAQEWQAIEAQMPAIMAFITANKASLSTK